VVFERGEDVIWGDCFGGILTRAGNVRREVIRGFDLLGCDEIDEYGRTLG